MTIDPEGVVLFLCSGELYGKIIGFVQCNSVFVPRLSCSLRGRWMGIVREVKNIWRETGWACMAAIGREMRANRWLLSSSYPQRRKLLKWVLAVGALGKRVHDCLKIPENGLVSNQGVGICGQPMVGLGVSLEYFGTMRSLGMWRRGVGAWWND